MINLMIRDALPEDIPAITSIYAHAVANTVATLDTDESTIASQTEWFEHHDTMHPVIVVVRDGAIPRWASLSEWSPKKGYYTTAEASRYLAPTDHGKGIGNALAQQLIRHSHTLGLNVLAARIASSNDASLRLARGCGFVDVGTMK
jgi:L-amino acid N-acyltransferase YncA